MKNLQKLLFVCSAPVALTLTAAQAQTNYLGGTADLDSSSAWSNGTPSGQTATIAVDGSNLPRWQSSMATGTIINHTAGTLTFTAGPYNSYGASNVITNFTYNMSGGAIVGDGQEFNINSHTFNFSGGAISSNIQFRLLNGSVMNISGSGTLTAATIGNSAGTMNFSESWTGFIKIADLDAASWKTMLATTLAGSTFDGVAITEANFDDNFVVTGSTLTLVPEPGTYTLIGGMLALGYVMVRRRRA